MAFVLSRAAWFAFVATTAFVLTRADWFAFVATVAFVLSRAAWFAFVATTAFVLTRADWFAFVATVAFVLSRAAWFAFVATTAFVLTRADWFAFVATMAFVLSRADWLALVFRSVILALDSNPESTLSILSSSVVKSVGKSSNAARSSGAKAVFRSETKPYVMDRPVLALVTISLTSLAILKASERPLTSLLT